MCSGRQHSAGFFSDILCRMAEHSNFQQPPRDSQNASRTELAPVCPRQHQCCVLFLKPCPRSCEVSRGTGQEKEVGSTQPRSLAADNGSVFPALLWLLGDDLAPCSAEWCVSCLVSVSCPVGVSCCGLCCVFAS